MTGLISTSYPSGRLGNQLFQLNFVNQLAVEFGFEILRPRYRDLRFMSSANGSYPLSLSVLKRPLIFGQEDVRGIGWPTFEEILRKASSQNRHVHLKPGFLGEFFRESSYRPWHQVLETNFNNFSVRSDEENVVLHFRGTDFATWDPVSILDSKYYLDAMEMILEKFPDKQFKFHLVSDDFEHEIVAKIISNSPVPLNFGRADAVVDFYKLLDADVIVHSASTYSFWASMLGQSQLNIYPRTWLDYKLGKKDKFWCDFWNYGFHDKKIHYAI